MAKHYALWPSRYSDCTDPEKLNMMPFVDEDVTNLGEFLCLCRRHKILRESNGFYMHEKYLG